MPEAVYVVAAGVVVAVADVCGCGETAVSCFRYCVAVWLAYCGAWTVCGSGRCVRCRQLCVLPALCCGAVLSVVTVLCCGNGWRVAVR